MYYMYIPVCLGMFFAYTYNYAGIIAAYVPTHLHTQQYTCRIHVYVSDTCILLYVVYPYMVVLCL